MTKRPRWRTVTGTWIASALTACAAAETPVPVDVPQHAWFNVSEGPDLPVAFGISDAFVGTVGNGVVVAGGRLGHAPSLPKGDDTYGDSIFILRHHGDSLHWTSVGNLPQPTACGAAVATADGMLCIGGENTQGALATVFRLRWRESSGDAISLEALPPLPEAISGLCATRLGQHVYVAGGQCANGNASDHFLALALDDPASGWRRLPGHPAPQRWGAALVAQHVENRGFVYLFGGQAEGHSLSDGFRYDPLTRIWQKTARLPRPALQAPALALGQSRILLFSGYTGSKEFQNAPDLAVDVLSYNTVTDTWAKNGELRHGVAATAATLWRGDVVIPGGVRSPHRRTAAVTLARPQTPACRFGALDQFMLYLYLSALTALCIVLYVRHRKVGTTEDYYLAGRSLPGWAAGMSLMATAVSSIGFMAIPAKTFTSDWTYFSGVFTWFIVVPVVVVAFVPFFRRINVSTAYELLESRFDLRVRTFAAVGFSLMEGGRMAIVLLLPATALATVTPLSTEHTIFLMGAGSTLYALAAGMRGVVWTDVVQGVIMLAGAMLCIVMVVNRIDGGFGEVLAVAASDGKFAFDLSWDPAAAGVWVVVIGNVFIRLSALTSSQSSVQRLLSTPNEKQAVHALWTDVLVSIPWAVIVFFLGTALYVFYKRFPEMLPPQMQDIEILPLFMSQQLPPGASGLVIAAIFAAGMSSLDTSMHSLSTTWARDFYGRFCPHATDRAQLFVSKTLIVFFGLIAAGSALLIHRAGIRGMWDFFISLFGLFGGILCGIFMLARFSRRATAGGTLAGGFLAFLVMILAWRQAWVHGLLYTALGTCLCVAFGLLLSRPSGRRDLL